MQFQAVAVLEQFSPDDKYGPALTNERVDSDTKESFI